MIANFASMQSKDIAYQVTRNYIVVFYFIGIYHDISHIWWKPRSILYNKSNRNDKNYFSLLSTAVNIRGLKVWER